MSDFIIEILEPTINYIEIETSFTDNISDNITIERYNDINLEIVNTEKVLASDLPDDIPMSKIIGNLHYTRVDGLETYITNIVSSGVSAADVYVDELLWGNGYVGLSGYLNQYQFDCGTP